MKNVFKAVLFAIVLVLSAAFVYSAANTPAFLPAIGAKSVNEGQPLNLILAATIADTGAINFSACQIVAPAVNCAGTPVNANALSTAPISVSIGATMFNYSYIDATHMGFNWTPDFTQKGTYKFRFNVSDDDTTLSAEDVVVTVNDVPPKLIVTGQLNIGSTLQARSNPNHDSINSRGQNVSGSIQITNEGTASEDLTAITAKLATEGGFSESDLKINFTVPQATLKPGESVTMPVKVRVPEKLDAVTQSLLTPSPFHVATIIFSAVSSTGVPVTASTQITLQAENNLEIVDNVKILYNGKSKSVGSDTTVKDIRAGQEIELEVNVKNTLTEKADVEIQDVTVRAVSGGLDIDEEEDLGGLSPQDKEKVKFTITIDEDADDNTYDLEISVEGRDEFGARHGERIIIQLEIKRKSHEVEIKGILVNPPSVSCEKEARASVSIRNSGKNKENDVVVRVASPELNFGAMTDPVELDEGDEDSASFTIPIPASLPRPANYRINIETYYSTSTLSNSDVVLLKVDKCGPAEEVQPPVAAPPKAEPPVVVIPPAIVTTQVNESKSAPAEKPFIQTPQYMALLAMGYLVVLGGGAALLIKLLRKP